MHRWSGRSAARRSSGGPPRPTSRFALSIDGTGRTELATGVAVPRPHAGPGRPPRDVRPRRHRQGRSAHRRAPHGRGHRHHARAGVQARDGRQEGHTSLRPRVRAARRGAVARRDRPVGASGPRIPRAVHARDDRDVRRRPDARILPGLRQSRAGARCTSTTCAATMRITRPRRCSRRSRARCGWRASAIRARPATIPSTKGTL